MNIKPTELNPSLVIITGMAGAGRTEAMHTFEDMGYFCIDNLPPMLIQNLVALAGLKAIRPDSASVACSIADSGVVRKLAVVCDLRSQEFFLQLNDELARISARGISYSLVFLDANDDSLLARFKASRRKHPLCEGTMTISDGIRKERKAMASVRERADFIIDTSQMDSRELRREIREFYSQETSREALNVSVFSFGFKHHTPTDADMLIDVRFLPNPYYDDRLRLLTGLSAPVRDFVLNKAETKNFLEAWRNLLSVIMPGYVNEGKRYLSIGIGCTGGQHRSVVLATETGAYLKLLGYQTLVTHRDLKNAQTKVDK
ncbi:MAG: RNase adapter RapZ [Coriobacteriales bacterium]|nr:RNase adapter RapZ [Coriobacteriales bacterium]